MKPILLTVDRPSLLADGDIVRGAFGAAFVVYPRRSGVVRAWAAPSSQRHGCPFARSLSPENQERLEAARAAVFGYED